ncbi:LysR family transcriptional regulator [Paracidovorax citrulli]|uniref:Transcriptional regulator, LysR family n=2 Tax=Paracidovorax citrulli TaxID=80869 RepID=A1TTT0_PARC0|nr:LysR family transcriptional regulator [Paracidovorax citrulli]ABM34368.1 transcriptional regulator, LysR family [Paracidovorax citrulli AAC00-1]ATG93839.1 LysR family transcriptional regulator [Paracidovorax citrulli]MVT27991.1 LysR family transcriptional regulator [Paracidovorax citrulli]MVT37194.1 LysR family transcriptional regulator [Paracidovorax citrulli]PVY63809.1 LysR family transcriptional regulator [Paracidovorax citrulli]
MKTKKVDALWSHVHWLGILDAEGSFTGAAHRLGVSKSAVSHRVSELEQAAGVALVRRTTRTVRLTDAGRHLVDSTRESFASIERSFANIRDLAQEPNGVLRVTVPVAFGRQHIVPRIPGFLRQYPQVRVELELSDGIRSLSLDGFDLAIRHVESVPDTHVAWPLCPTETVLVASRAYLEACGVPGTPHDLARHNCLHYLRGASVPSWSFERTGHRADAPRLSIPIAGTFAANNSEALRTLAIAGAGIAMLPDFSVSGEIGNGELVRVLPGWRPVGAFGTRISAVRTFSTHVPRAVRVFVAYLRESMHGGFLQAS